jgi:fatty acid elongase 3
MLSNSLVHVVMYYYYMLVTLGKSVWWKKYLTVFQVRLLAVLAGFLFGIS